MKAKMCVHTVGMQYQEGRFEPSSDVRAKRRKGRPRNLPKNCLAVSPVQIRNPQEILEKDDAPLKKTTKRKRKQVANVEQNLNLNVNKVEKID